MALVTSTVQPDWACSAAPVDLRTAGSPRCTMCCHNWDNTRDLTGLLCIHATIMDQLKAAALDKPSTSRHLCWLLRQKGTGRLDCSAMVPIILCTIPMALSFTRNGQPGKRLFIPRQWSANCPDRRPEHELQLPSGVKPVQSNSRHVYSSFEACRCCFSFWSWQLAALFTY